MSPFQALRPHHGLAEPTPERPRANMALLGYRRDLCRIRDPVDVPEVLRVRLGVVRHFLAASDDALPQLQHEVRGFLVLFPVGAVEGSAAAVEGTWVGGLARG